VAGHRRSRRAEKARRRHPGRTPATTTRAPAGAPVRRRRACVVPVLEPPDRAKRLADLACPGLGLRSPHAQFAPRAPWQGRAARPLVTTDVELVIQQFGQATQNNLAICWYIHMSAGMASISPRSVGQVVPDAAAADGAFSPARRSALLANGFSSGEAAPSRRAFVDHLLTDDNRDARQNDHR
jgi:hypothetical protein